MHTLITDIFSVLFAALGTTEGLCTLRIQSALRVPRTTWTPKSMSNAYISARFLDIYGIFDVPFVGSIARPHHADTVFWQDTTLRGRGGRGELSSTLHFLAAPDSRCNESNLLH